MRYFAAGSWEAALRSLDSHERITAGIPEIVRLRGQVLYKMQRWKQAIPLLRTGSANEAEKATF